MEITDAIGLIQNRGTLPGCFITLQELGLFCKNVRGVSQRRIWLGMLKMQNMEIAAMGDSGGLIGISYTVFPRGCGLDEAVHLKVWG